VSGPAIDYAANCSSIMFSNRRPLRSGAGHVPGTTVIVLDEQLLGRNIEREIARCYRLAPVFMAFVPLPPVL